MENEKLNKARNNLGIKGEVDYVNSLIEKEQVEPNSHVGSDFPVEKHVDDVSKDFAKLDDPTIGTKGESEFPDAPSMARFAKKHVIDEGEIRKNEGMKLNQKVDDTAKGSGQ
ncbi:MAG: hypothetical protein ACE14S_02295 [Candidatus Bathyarchaeia archaeon]